MRILNLPKIKLTIRRDNEDQIIFRRKSQFSHLRFFSFLEVENFGKSCQLKIIISNVIILNIITIFNKKNPCFYTLSFIILTLPNCLIYLACKLQVNHAVSGGTARNRGLASLKKGQQQQLVEGLKENGDIRMSDTAPKDELKQGEIDFKVDSSNFFLLDSPH